MPILTNTNTPTQQHMNMNQEDEHQDHILIFPFMAKGHTIPLIHLASALSSVFSGDICKPRISFITTPGNAPFLRSALPFDNVHLIVLPFPDPTPPLPPNVESTDALPSFDLLPLFLATTSLLRNPIDALLTHLARSSSSPPLCLISDFFFGWTLPICRRLQLPRIAFHGMSAFSMTLCKSLWIHLPELPTDSGAPFHVPGTPEGLLVSKEDIPESVLKSTDLNDPGTQFVSELGESDLNSWGVIVNSFDEVEGEYVTLFEKFYRNGARAWLVGPLCLFSGEASNADNECLRWLDEQSPGSVVYVSFGTQAHVANEQLDEAAHGLAESGFAVLWAVRSETWAPPTDLLTRPDFKIIKWVPQKEVLRHAATGGFVSHCGWNSVMEAASAGVPMLTWPMIAEQTLNAKHVVDELGIGLRLASSGEIVRRKKVREGVRELMGGNTVRERVAELGKKARRAVEEGGASRRRLVELVEELRKCRRGREGEIIINERVDGVEFHEGVQSA